MRRDTWGERSARSHAWRGEFDLCFALSGAPTFDGHPPGWVVLPPNSWHVPTVAGGRMAILYFLPGGAFQMGPETAPA